jgi:hypothetical protein
MLIRCQFISCESDEPPGHLLQPSLLLPARFCFVLASRSRTAVRNHDVCSFFLKLSLHAKDVRACKNCGLLCGGYLNSVDISDRLPAVLPARVISRATPVSQSVTRFCVLMCACAVRKQKRSREGGSGGKLAKLLTSFVCLALLFRVLLPCILSCAKFLMLSSSLIFT